MKNLWKGIAIFGIWAGYSVAVAFTAVFAEPDVTMIIGMVGAAAACFSTLIIAD